MALLAGLALLTGRGGGSADSTGSTAASGELSESEWLAQADEICEAEGEDVAPLNKELDRLNESGLSAPKEVAAFAAILRKALPRSERGIRELREPEPPSEDSDAIDVVLRKDEETQELIKKTAEKMEEGNIADAKLLSLKAGMASRTAQWIAQRYGLEFCETAK